jgi:phosphodiesterase/alkaline phosphatase D-like protein
VDAVAVDGAPPYRLARFELAGLPAGGRVEYCAAGAQDAASLPQAEELLATAPAGAGGSFKTLPLPNDRPPRVALVTCNGVHGAPEATRYQLWRKLKEKIADGEIDLILFAGDQIYADPIWAKHDSLDTFRDVPAQDVENILTAQYRDWYVKSWTAPDVQAVLSSCPSLMMWDDHDIFDGYGSHDDDLTPSAQLYFRAAKRAFSELQAAHNPEPLGPSSFGFAFEYGDLGFLVLDGRTNRAYLRGHVLGDAQLHLVSQRLKALVARKMKHLFVVAGVPIMHAPVAAALALFGASPSKVDAEDDLRDSWVAENNRPEMEKLLGMLFEFSKASGTQVSILSGDVHVATIGSITSSRPEHRPASGQPARIHQVVSSAIGCLPPSGTNLALIKAGIGIVNGRHDLGRDLVGQLHRFEGASNPYFLDRRNFAIVKVTDGAAAPDGRLWIDFFCEEPTGVVVRQLRLPPA